MDILKIVTGLCVSLLFPNEQALQHARMGQIGDIQQEYQNKNCHNIQSLPKLSDALQCYTLDFMLQRKDNYIATGIFYHMPETGMYEITSKNYNPVETQSAPYGHCRHYLILKTVDTSDPLTIHRTLISQCTDPTTKETIKVDLTEINKRYLQ